MQAGWIRASAALVLALANHGCGQDAADGASGAAGAAHDPVGAPAPGVANTQSTAASTTAAAAPRSLLPPGKLPNIIVYLVDTLRADGLAVLGNTRDTSPGIDAFSRRAAVFEMAIAQAPWTLTSVTSLFTSTYPVSHQVLSKYSIAGEQAQTMVEFMHDLGYHTVGFVTNTFGGKGAGLDQGYDEFFEQLSVRDFTHEQLAAGAYPLKPLFDWAAAYTGEQPVFLYVHTMEPHNPWSGPHERAPWITGTLADRNQLNEILPEQRGLLARRSLGTLDEPGVARLQQLTAEIAGRLQEARDLYDGDVREANDNFRRLIGILSYRPRWASTMIVLLADHGEELYEHGNWYHGQSVYQELVHVPLVLRVPGLTNAGLRIAQPVQVIDVLPTLADLLGAPAAPQWQGRSLLPLLRAARDGTPEPAAPPVFTMRINVETLPNGELVRSRTSGRDRGDVETAVIEDGWKLIVHQEISRASLYDLRNDPGEQHDLADAEPERARRLLGLVQQRLRELPALDLRRADPGDQAEQDERRAQLEELGYIEGHAPR